MKSVAEIALRSRCRLIWCVTLLAICSMSMSGCGTAPDIADFKRYCANKMKINVTERLAYLDYLEAFSRQRDNDIHADLASVTSYSFRIISDPVDIKTEEYRSIRKIFTYKVHLTSEDGVEFANYDEHFFKTSSVDGSVHRECFTSFPDLVNVTAIRAKEMVNVR